MVEKEEHIIQMLGIEELLMQTILDIYEYLMEIQKMDMLTYVS
jgi:hypothetical protein